MRDSEKIRYRAHILVCSGKSCSKAHDPDAAKKYLKGRVKEEGLQTEVRAGTCSCLDYCDDSPNVVVYPEGTLYKSVREEDLEAIFRKHALKK
jgi:(2Fe-2S) ferredoxin